MFQIKICDVTGDATLSCDGREVGMASFANNAQRRLFREAIEGGARPARAAEASGAIYLPAETYA